MLTDKDKDFSGAESKPVSTKEGKDGKVDAPKKKQKKYPLWKNVLAMVVLVALFITGAYWASIFYTRHGKVRDSIHNRNIPPGVICDQSVHAGNYVKIGRTIGLTVNSDHAPTLVLPDVADNMSYREATAKLRSMGFTLGDPEYIEGERDWVYSVKYKGYNVSVGTRIDINEPITLVVGDGHYMMDELEFDAYGDTIGSVYGDILEIF